MSAWNQSNAVVAWGHQTDFAVVSAVAVCGTCRRQQWRLIQQRCRRPLRRSRNQSFQLSADCRCVHPCCGLQLARIASACKSCCRTCKHHSNAYSYQVYYFINYATVHVYILYIKPCKSQWSKHVIFRLRPKLQSAHNELTI